MKNAIKSHILLLFLMFFIIIFLMGLANGILQAFGYIPPIGLESISLKYLHRVLIDKNLYISLGISFYVATVSSFLSVSFAIIISFSLITLKKNKGILYFLIKIPMFIPWIVTALLTINIISKSGLIARIFYWIGYNDLVKYLNKILYHKNNIGVIIAFIWACTPFACFFIMDCIESVDKTLGEAARNLGATTKSVLKEIIIPVCMDQIKKIFIIIFLSCFGNYEIPMILGTTNPRALPVWIYYEYSHLDYLNRPYTMALNTIMLIVSLVIAGVFYKLFFNRKVGVKYNKENENN